MAWYGQKNYQQKVGNGPYTIAQIGCFLVAFCNLMQKFGSNNIDPPTLNQDFNQRGVYLPDPSAGAGIKEELGYNSVTAINGQIKVVQTVDHGHAQTAGWPNSNNAIVKFYYSLNGHMTTHFCLVADANARTIVDSWDGVIKGVGHYGQPVAWTTYDYVVPQPVTKPHVPVKVNSPSVGVVAELPTPTPPAPRAGVQYKFQKGDTFYSIAPRFHTTAAALMEYNDITDAEAHNIPVGFEIYILPTADSAPSTSGYTIEPLPEPKTYHITRKPYANKWGFGNIRTWADFVSNGQTTADTDVTITAVATVIVGKETAAYYMDNLAYNNGKVINTIGYNWSDLAEGAYSPPAPAAAPAPATAAATIPTVSTVPSASTTTAPADSTADTTDSTPSTTAAPASYKSTYDTFKTPQIYEVTQTATCPECDGRRQPHTLQKGQAVSIIGTFVKGQTLYGRPTGAAKAGFWFGVPMDDIELQDVVFDTKTTIPEKQVLNASLTLGEKLVVLIGNTKRALEKTK
jgi:LysM repeat protein